MSYYDDSKDGFLRPVVKQYNNHMVMTNVHRSTKTKYWNIDTQFRDDYQDMAGSRPIVMSLPEAITNVKSISVSSIQLPMTFYNVTSALNNNVLYFVDVSRNSTHTLVVPDGYYTAATLVAAVNTQFASAGYSDLTMTTVNGKTTFGSSATSNYSYVVSFAVGHNAGVGSECGGVIGLDKYGVKNHLGWLLGFRGITYTVVGQGSVTSEAMNRLTPKYVYLVVDEFLTSNPNSFVSPMYDSLLNRNVLAKINLDYVFYGFGTVLSANLCNGYLDSDCREYGGTVNLKRLKVQLVNETGMAINLNGEEFSFVLQIAYE